MKIVLSNRQYFEDTFKDCKDELKYKTTKEIHNDLYNRVNIDFNTQNKIEVILLIPYKKIGDGDCVFCFIGKNKDMFFYEFQSTVS